MADVHYHLQRQHQRPHRISVPPRSSTPNAFSGSTARTPYPMFPYSSSTPTPTPSKNGLSSFNSKSSNKNSFSFLFLLLFSLRSLYSLLPFLRSAPSFSLFPFTFLVSLLSFLLTLSFSFFTSPSSSFRNPFRNSKQNPLFFSLSLITPSQYKVLIAKSILLSLVFLLRFQALRYCGTAAMILAELSGNVAARSIADGSNQTPGDRSGSSSSKVRGSLALFSGLFLLSVSWDRYECFPLATSYIEKWGFSLFPREKCLRIWPMVLPFLSGFLGCYERISPSWGTIRQLGPKRIRLVSLFLTTVVLFVPAVISMLMFEAEGDGVSVESLLWPLANTVVFGVLLSENYSDDKLVTSKDFRSEFLVTFACTLVLELFYFPALSLWGLLLCGLLLYIAARELDPSYSNYLELGVESSESFTASVMKPIRHILSERKSRKIALFLLINTGYMVVEFVAGFMSNSLGLISDACHMLFDCAALAIGLYASYISRLPANSQFNYGRGRFEVLSGYANAVFLVLVGALIALESFERILDPQEISTNSLLTVSIGGLLVNVIGLIFFHEEHHHAHGGGSCSHHSHSHSESHLHSHSHSRSHSHQCSHHHIGHDHGSHGKHENIVSVHKESGEMPCYEPSGKVGHHEHTHLHRTKSNGSTGTLKIGSCDRQRQHDHGDCGHHHEQHHQAHDHGRHDCSHHHEHHRQAHEHDHRGHHHHHHSAHQYIHEDHAFKKENHDFAHQHETHCQHQGGHNLHGGFAHGFSDIRSSEVDNLGDPHAQGTNMQPSVSCSDSASFFSAGNEVSQHKNSTPDGEKPQKQHHRHIDHNMEGIFLHVLADTMGSVGVVISTLLIKYKGWLVADPACSIFISVMIISSVIPLLRNSAEILLQRVPRAHEHEVNNARNDIMRIKGVCGIQNLHVWNLTNTDVVGTVHLHVSTENDKAYVRAQVSQILHNAGVKDLTLQVESIG